MNNRRPAVHGFDNAIGGSDRIPPGRWIYVGGTADPGWTAESPPFQNGWGNAGGGLRSLRFRLTNEDQVEIEGSVNGGAAGTVVTTLPDVDAVFRASVLWPDEDTYAVGAAGDDSVVIWLLHTNGDLEFVGTVVGVSVPELEALGFIHFGGTNLGGGQVLDIATEDGNFTVDTNDGQVLIHSNTGSVVEGDALVAIRGGEVQIELGSGQELTVFDSGASAMLKMADGSFIEFHTDNFSLRRADDTLIFDYQAGTGEHVFYDLAGVPIMRLDDDGTLHLTTDGSIAFDL